MTSSSAASVASQTDGGRPPVAVIVPTRDRPELVRRAVRSVLDQTYDGAIECVVVADQSTPPPALPEPHCSTRTVAVVRNDRTPGLAGARNTGILASRAPLFAFLDDDDEWLPEKLERQADILARSPDLGLVGTAIEIVLQNRRVRRSIPDVITREHLLRRRVIALNPSTLLARRALLDRAGLVDEAIPGAYGEDYEWLLRALRHTDAVGLDDPLVRISWARTSWFAGRWETMADGLQYIVERHPDLLDDDRGAARILGQIAFARASAGHRSPAVGDALRSLGRRLNEPRALLALGVAARLIPPDCVRRTLSECGRGL